SEATFLNEFKLRTGQSFFVVTTLFRPKLACIRRNDAMRTLSIVAGIFLGWLALVVAQMIAGAAIPVRIAMPPNAFAWFLLTDLISAGVLGCVALRSQPTGMKLGVVMVAIPLGIALVNLIEGAFFLSQPGVGWGRIAMQTILGYLLVAPAWAFIFGRMRRPQI